MVGAIASWPVGGRCSLRPTTDLIATWVAMLSARVAVHPIRSVAEIAISVAIRTIGGVGPIHAQINKHVVISNGVIEEKGRATACVPGCPEPRTVHRVVVDFL